MQLRCLGGPNDGEWYRVELNSPDYDKFCIGDTIQIKCNRYIYDYSAIIFDPAEIPERMTIKVNLYRIACFCFEKNDLYYFLVPEGWTDKQALVHQLEKNYKEMEHDK